MDFLLSEATSGASGTSGDSSVGAIIAAGISLLAAIVTIFGPVLARKMVPQDETVAELAKSSSASVASALESTLAMVRGDMAHVRTKTDENSGKLDALLATGKGKR